MRLSVTDNGSGIPPHDLPYVFDPFYTTRSPGEHAGLGLATIHGAINQVGGFVEIDSSRTSGTRVDVWIPCVDVNGVEPGRMSHRWSIPDLPKAGSGPRTVLVVDDEELLLELTARILRRAGWTVLTASSAEAAITARD